MRRIIKLIGKAYFIPWLAPVIEHHWYFAFDRKLFIKKDLKYCDFWRLAASCGTRPVSLVLLPIAFCESSSSVFAVDILLS